MQRLVGHLFLLLLLAVRAQIASSLPSRQHHLRRSTLQVVRLTQPGHQIDEGRCQVENVIELTGRVVERERMMKVVGAFEDYELRLDQMVFISSGSHLTSSNSDPISLSFSPTFSGAEHSDRIVVGGLEREVVLSMSDQMRVRVDEKGEVEHDHMP